MFLRNGVDDLFNVRDIVCDRGLAILGGHPTGYNIPAAATIEAVQTLNGNKNPGIGALHSLQAFKLDFGRLRIAMKTNQHRCPGSTAIHQVSAVRDCLDRSLAESHDADSVTEDFHEVDRKQLHALQEIPLGTA